MVKLMKPEFPAVYMDSNLTAGVKLELFPVDSNLTSRTKLERFPFGALDPDENSVTYPPQTDVERMASAEKTNYRLAPDSHSGKFEGRRRVCIIDLVRPQIGSPRLLPIPLFEEHTAEIHEDDRTQRRKRDCLPAEDLAFPETPLHTLT